MSDTPRIAEALKARYRIERELGEGGMATVLLAEDLKHDRRVAIKVLKPELAAVIGAERFVAEIKTTASLQHPHILPLFESGEADGFLYYVMPYVEGESLRDKLDREKQLGVDEAVKTAVALASALHYAHERGVVHRDIKPANILIHAGQPVVADFGIAIAISAAGGGRLTETGMSVGTPHYMSPEQATADRDVDARSDIYSLACVTYEMLAGDPPHAGSSAQAVIMRILTEEPRDLTEVRKSVPRHVSDALARAMEKLPADRFESAAAFAEALQNPAFRYRTATSPAAGVAAPSRGWLGGSALAVVAALGLGALLGRGLGADKGPYDVGLPFEAPMWGDAGQPLPAFAVAPDATFILYETPDGIWYRSLIDDEARPVLGAEEGQGSLMISPDGTRVAFVSDGVRMVEVEGGRPVAVTDDANAWAGVWTGGGQLFYGVSDGAGVRWVDPESGSARDLFVGYCLMATELSGTELLCGGGDEKFARVATVAGDSVILRSVTQRTATGQDLLLRGSHFRPVDDYLVYTTIDGSIAATKWVDREALVVGRSVPLVTGIRRTIYSGAGYYDLAENGTLVYASGANMEVAEMAIRTFDGAPEILPLPPAAHLRFNLDPTGRRLASVVEAIGGQELRIYDLGSGEHQVIETARYISTPFWSRDGQALVFQRKNEGSSVILRYRFDSTGVFGVIFDALSDDETLVWWREPEIFLITDQTGGRMEILRDPERGGQPELLVAGDVFFASISPDGRWLAWTLGEEGLFVEQWPERSRRWRVASGPVEPYWLSDGTLVLHWPGGTVATARETPGGDEPFAPFEVRVLDPRKGETPGWSTMITADDRLMHPVSPDQILVNYVRVVPGWVDQMKRAVDEANR